MDEGRKAFPRAIFGAVDPTTGQPLPVGARLVLSALWSFARWWESDPWVFPSAATLAADLGLAERSIWRHLATLTAAGWIRRERRQVEGGGSHDGWTLVLPTLTARSEDRDDADRVPRHPDPDATVRGPGQSEAGIVRVPRQSGSRIVSPSKEEEPRSKTKKRSIARARESEIPSEFVDQVIEHLARRVHEVTQGADRGPQVKAPGNRDMVRKATRREKATLEDWIRVIDAQAESVRGRPEAWRWLNLSTIHRPKTFARLRDAPRAGGTRLARHSPSSFPQQPQQPLALDPELDAEIGDIPF